MDKLSALQLSRIVALELIPEDVDEDEVKYYLGVYGRIIDIQFWTSNNGNRHGFVTFQDPKAASSCLYHAHDLPPRLVVKAPHKTIMPRYRTPPASPKGHTKSIGAADDQSPSLISRMSASHPVTPTRQPHLQLKQESAPVLVVDASGLPPGSASSLSSIPRAESHLASNGTHDPPQQIKNSMPNTLLPTQQPLSTWPSRSQHWKPDPPSSAPTDPRQVRNSTIHDPSENKRHEAEITRLKDEIQELHSTLRNIQDSGNSALQDVTEKAYRYKQERDDLSSSMEAADKNVKYYKTLSEDLRRNLDRERDVHEDRERALQLDLRNSSKEIFDLKRQLADQSRILSRRASELLHSKQQLLAMKNAGKSRLSENERDPRSDIQHARNSSEPEEGQVNESQNGRSNPSLQDPSHRRMVLPALEKAFIYLEELTNATLLEAQPVDERDSNTPNKRQRLSDT